MNLNLMNVNIVNLSNPAKFGVLEIGEAVRTLDGGDRFIWSYYHNGRRLEKSGYAQDFDGKISDVVVTQHLSFQGLCQQASLVPGLKADIEESEAEAARRDTLS